jgi:hypothetical protein
MDAGGLVNRGRKPVNMERSSEGVDDRDVSKSILEAMRGVRYGSIEIVIHDARIVQIVRTEKLRIER